MVIVSASRKLLALLLFFPFTSLLVCIVASVPQNAEAQISSSLFGMHANAGVICRQPWPNVLPAGIRLWDTGTAWAAVNPSPGKYDWTQLDGWLNKAQANGADILYTLGQTPAWASSDPYDTTCMGAGHCQPPSDLNQDGTGPNRYWQDYVRAIVTHNMQRTSGRIKYWEIWNEPHHPYFWKGTFPQMVRLAADARSIIKSIDPSAVVLTPAPGIEGSRWGSVGRQWLDNYLAAGGGRYADVIAFHGYVTMPNVYPSPEDFVGFMNSLKTLLASYKQNWKPKWDTEASWGNIYATGFTDQDLQAGFVARFYLLHVSANVQRLYWYSWNNYHTGLLWQADAANPSGSGTLLKPGIAYEQVKNWLVGASLVGPCTATGTVWTCTLKRPNGYRAQAVWDTSKTCGNGSCTTTNYAADPQFTKYRNLSGKIVTITGTVVPIGAKPILLENQ